MNRRQPRSRREIIQSLTEMMESELFEVHKPSDNTDLKNKTSRRPSTLKDNQDSKPPSPTKAKPSPRSSFTSDKPLLEQRRDSQPRKSSIDSNKAISLKESSSQSSLSSNNKKGKVSKLPTILTPRDKQSQNVHLPAIAEGRENSSLTSSREISTFALRQEITDMTLKDEDESLDVSPRESMSAKKEYERKEVPATSKSPTKFPPLAKPELKKPETISPTKWESALR